MKILVFAMNEIMRILKKGRGINKKCVPVFAEFVSKDLHQV